MQLKSKITACLWFDNQAEQAAKFYTSIFKDSKIHKTSHYTEAGREVHGRPPGSVMTVEFELAGQRFTALNGGPIFKFTEATSFVINCANQKEVDYFWSKLTAGGGQESQCGWLKDKFGLSWQIVPTVLFKMLHDKNPKKVASMFRTMLTMGKLDIKKHPSISETLDWTRALVLLNVDSLEHDLVGETLSVILKYEGDIKKAQQELKEFRELQRAKQKQQVAAPGMPSDKKDVLH